MLQRFYSRIKSSLTAERHIAPLAVLRMAFGAIMFISTVRFMLKGWIAQYYLTPKFFFGFYGFEWVKPFGAAGMYAVYVIMALAALGIMAGYFYRISITVFFFSFCYVELLDKTYYLNHYYFVSIFTFLLMLVPAHRYCSLDVIRKPSLKRTQVPGWTIVIFQLQLFLVYFFAGVSKLTYDWMCMAMPLRIWLPANSSLPLIGPLLRETWVAFFFSWFGAVYDLVIGFLLLKKKTRGIAYFFVVIFHVLTGWLFHIGMFPYIMIFVTIIFFSEDFHRKLIARARKLLKMKPAADITATYVVSPLKNKILAVGLVTYFILQLLLPFRFLLYPGTLFWTEEGYRFSWRVMLMEKNGTAFFYVKDPQTGKKAEVNNADFLTPMQEKMMTTQPDMILQYAHFLAGQYSKKGIKDPVVTVESYVTLNGSGSRLYIDSTTNLAKEYERFQEKKWIMPFQKRK